MQDYQPWVAAGFLPGSAGNNGSQRLLARYDFEDGGHVEVRLVGDVETETALDMVETLIGIRRKELAARKRRASSSEANAPSDDKAHGLNFAGNTA